MSVKAVRYERPPRERQRECKGGGEGGGEGVRKRDREMGEHTWRACV